jgi:hypothetical protein
VTRIRRVAPALVLLLLPVFAGCFHVSVRSPASDRGPSKEKVTTYHIFYGLTSSEVSAPECQNGIAKLTYYHPWWSILFLTPCTAGLVGATVISYRCADLAAAPAPAVASAPGPETSPAIPAAVPAPPASFSESAPAPRDVIDLPEGVDAAQAWQRIQTALSKSFTLQNKDGIVEGEWSAAFATGDLEGRYRVRVRVQQSPDKKKIAVSTQAQWLDSQQAWKSGADSEVQKAIVGQVRDALKNP